MKWRKELIMKDENKFTIVSQNVRNSVISSSILNCNVQHLGASILCVQEPNYYNSIINGFPKMNIFNHKEKPRSAIVSSLNNIIGLSQFTTSHCTTVMINTNNPIILSSVYLSRNIDHALFNAETKAIIISSKRNIDQQQIVLSDDHVDVHRCVLNILLENVMVNTWGLSFDVLKHIYIMAIEPIMLFACSIWGNKVNKKCITKLRSVQRNFVLSMIRGYKTISFDAAFVIADILPIDLRIQYLNHIYILRTNGVFLGLRCQLKVPISSLNHPASTILRANCNDNHDFIIFTDGSKINGHLGSSFVVYKNIDEDPIFQAKFRLANYCTVYQAEQFAIERAAFWLKDKQSTAIIYTDSLSTVNAINNRWNTDYLIHQIRTWIKDKHICIEWIRGHQQNIGNELAK
ncbi:hypothetical protein DERP_011579 [Dermatophagoides pteronyssinus]|uniref:RNase H type-1 domain-containing protein n=1 Tax=Dermatophagoides pteronyssinus TaxID=6956 RepID=A0ABQ8JWV7_DERPT|nr:hypothetical protein DERP_011579 [Dermatophagoides pteronyssinus]